MLKYCTYIHLKRNPLATHVDTQQHPGVEEERCVCGVWEQGRACSPARRRGAITVAHLARGLALLLGKDDLDDTALEFTAIHAVLGVVRLVDVRELDEGEWLCAPAAVRRGGEGEE